MSETHHDQMPIEYLGMRLDLAEVAVLMLHGRGGGTESILPLITHFPFDDVAFVAPEARDKSWYPQPFTSSRQENQPFVLAALRRVGNLLNEIEEAGIPREKTILLGFSQGAIVALEYVARHPQRFGGVIAFSGGVLGSDDDLIGYGGSLAGTPIFIGSSEGDALIPVERVRRTAAILQALGADVDLRLYNGNRHEMNADEIATARTMIEKLIEA